MLQIFRYLPKNLRNILVCSYLIIIRKLNSPTIEVLKKKGQTFKILENLVKDSGVLDMEEAESLETQEA